MITISWPLTSDATYPPDTPLAHLRNGLQALQLHREVVGIPASVTDVWSAAEHRIALAIQGLEALQSGGFVVEPPR